jgi:asparagine synthase (glutamine-hydrolysing)
VGGVTIACDRADLLAGLAGAQLDEAQVAVRLLWPVPHPLLDTPLWRGLEAVRAGSSVVISPAGRPRFSRWWTAPEPTASLAAGAPALAEALAVAVRARTTGRATVSTDLSGGLDSTSVCFLAAAGDARVLAGTWPGRDPADDDLAWARRAAAHLPQVEHLVWPAEASPLVYEQLLDIDDPLDEPTIGLPDRARVLCHIPLLRDRGSQVHLTGIGGDHLTWSAEAHYHGVLRRNPRLALRNLRGFRALFDWRPTQLARALADNSTYSGWLARAAEQLRDPVPDAGFCALGWGQPPRLHPWMTELVFAESRRALRRAAATAEPLAGTRGEHADLEQIRVTTRILRQWDQMCARLGLPMASPFLDDRVIDVCLAVRPEERVTPWQYKPLLVAAMRGIVPDECLARTTKAQAALDVARGLQRHRTDLLTLWEDSRLETLGLVDTKALRELTLRPSTPGMQEAVLYSTICIELWLRTLEAAEPLRAARHA